MIPDKLCEHCGEPFRGRKEQRYCSVQHGQLGRFGSVDPQDRFWKWVNKNGPIPLLRPELGPCWEWTGTTIGNGYGNFKLTADRGYERTHRLSWEFAYGPIPTGLLVLHHCDNPPCVNNSGHLFLGTHKDNMLDARNKARLGKLDMATAQRIRSEYAAGGVTQSDLADWYGVRQNQISRIINNQKWVV